MSQQHFKLGEGYHTISIPATYHLVRHLSSARHNVTSVAWKRSAVDAATLLISCKVTNTKHKISPTCLEVLLLILSKIELLANNNLNNMMSTTGKMIELHNNAITQLLEGNEEECIHMLLHCLAASRVIEVKTGSERQELTNNDDMEDEPSIFEVSLEEVIHADCEETRILRDAVDGNVRLYRCIFGTDSLETIPDQATLLQFVAIVTYNLGMIQHERASLFCDTKTLAKAKSLYTFALQLLCNPLACQGVLDVSALELALYNNLAHLFSFFLDHEGCSACLHRLGSKVGSVQPNVMEANSMGIFIHNCHNRRHIIATPLAPAA